MACTLWLAASLYPPSLAASYDEQFRYSHGRFLAWFDADWTWLRSQGIAESNLDPRATSSANARGIMQFLDGTWRDCQRALRINASPYNPRASIICGGWYMDRLLRTWHDPRRSHMDRWRWSWASYNWGLGNALRAQKRIYGSTRYDHLEKQLPAETRGYVERIERIHSRG